MLTFSKVGKKGNLGNQLFQIAATIGLAQKHGHDYAFLPWQYQSFFKNPLPVLATLPEKLMSVTEKQFHHHDWDFPDSGQAYDLVGWLQSERYFDRAKTQHYFEFTDSLVSKLKSKYELAFEKPTILVSIRRGDFVNHPDYLQLPIQFYLNALLEFFPDWQSRNLIVLSDDIGYCKFHFSFLDNVFFGDGLNAIEQLCLGSLCDDFIISNSTFSWWTAWLGEKQHSKIICPHQNFDGDKRKQCDDRDYFPKRWIRYDAEGKKIRLAELRFEFHFENNRDLLSGYLAHYFETNASDHSDRYIFEKDYFLPPLLVYYSYWVKQKSQHRPVHLYLNECKVSKKLNYEEFSNQLDFGFFSSIFKFETKRATSRSVGVKIQSQQALDTEPIAIAAAAGRFTATAFGFSWKRYLRRLEIQLKSHVKKILFPRKK